MVLAYVHCSTVNRVLALFYFGLRPEVRAMKLHEDKDAFGLLLENIHEKTGYRTDVLEKDYYVLLILQELSNF